MFTQSSCCNCYQDVDLLLRFLTSLSFDFICLVDWIKFSIELNLKCDAVDRWGVEVRYNYVQLLKGDYCGCFSKHIPVVISSFEWATYLDACRIMHIATLTILSVLRTVRSMTRDFWTRGRQTFSGRSGLFKPATWIVVVQTVRGDNVSCCRSGGRCCQHYYVTGSRAFCAAVCTHHSTYSTSCTCQDPFDESFDWRHSVHIREVRSIHLHACYAVCLMSSLRH
jgi:hypothetical protein